MNNRPLKFRVWDKKESRFLDQNEKIGLVLIDLSGKIRFAEWSVGNGDNSADSVFEPADSQERYVIQQYTGLKCKDGKEIYEGDIVLHDSLSKPIYNAPIIEYFFIKFITQENVLIFSLTRYENNKDYSLYNYWKGSEIEVVGNIFETPELLK